MDLKNKNMPNKYLLLVDEVCLIISFILAAWIRFGYVSSDWYSNISAFATVFVLLLYMVIYYGYDTYSKLFQRGFLEELFVVLKSNCILAVILTAVLYLFQAGSTYSRLFFICFFTLNTIVTFLARQYYKILLLAVYKRSSSSKKIMIVTTSDQIGEILNKFIKVNTWEYEVTYITILDKHMVGQTIQGVAVKADFINMFAVAKEQVIDVVFIHIPNSYPINFDLEQTILEFENMGITVHLSINTFGLNIHEKIVQQMSGYNVLTFSSRLFDDSQLELKRMVDIVGGLIGCLLTVLFTIFIAPAIIIESPGPVFFSQTRVGRNGRRFKIYKYRSMFIDAEERKAELLAKNEMNGFMFKLKDDPRITKVGKFLRKTSLDEFPQFLNILKGDMSLVGTRPPTEDEFLQYECRHKRRLALKSGLTGLWQVSGRSDIFDFEEVVKLDLEYIDNWSLFMDIKILMKTIIVVLFKRGSR